MSTTHQFLSPAWLSAVRTLKVEHQGDAVDVEGFLVNGIVTDVPFGEPTLEMHSNHGPVIGWEPGLAAEAPVTLTLSYATARSLVLDSTPNALELALHAGEIEVEGAFDELRDWWRTRVGDDDIADLEAAIRAITA
jgi:hypothetical protein